MFCFFAPYLATYFLISVDIDVVVQGGADPVSPTTKRVSAPILPLTDLAPKQLTAKHVIM
jgi:hypothetical protein